ncbi:hypothetical protein CpipJ_CPIJ003505 [Culex quinquefasciatus]|uniref:Uncharacterized protein n=1 Tax=Culex quinquefasciatus TaxID=7176 RepID=B0W8T0_CULQU|nr:hypothetical protein CpipJ_CPIJ003505 [Culex quinquefasciatus]|eukprot:XP_001845145.1 hypothetical protein CpipJ_CPIJ003505 [Culex quinquefasciatus]
MPLLLPLGACVSACSGCCCYCCYNHYQPSTDDSV